MPHDGRQANGSAPSEQGAQAGGAAAGDDGVRTIAIDGRRFGWRSCGEGRPLLLVNGYAASSADWDPTLLQALGCSFALICPDNRGTGASQLGEALELTIDAMAADLRRLLDALEIERAPVVGWSMGSYVAQRLALSSPARVEALVLLASAPGGSAAVPAEPDVWERLTDHSGTPREQATRLISLLFPADVALEIDRQFGEAVAEARAQLSPDTLAAQERALQAWHAEPQVLPGGDAPPVLAICGSEDIVVPAQNTDALAARWPGTRAERIAGAGHAFMAQQPERVAQLIVDFVKR
jgi:pimeloyl-ACP methyl ester carboxylesterase